MANGRKHRIKGIVVQKNKNGVIHGTDSGGKVTKRGISQGTESGMVHGTKGQVVQETNSVRSMVSREAMSIRLRVVWSKSGVDQEWCGHGLPPFCTSCICTTGRERLTPGRRS